MNMPLLMNALRKLMDPLSFHDYQGHYDFINGFAPPNECVPHTDVMIIMSRLSNLNDLFFFFPSLICM